jgi:phosphatidylserine/phosphatidylglycerophosphate/cardiolipin synthase-like enzyme
VFEGIKIDSLSTELITDEEIYRRVILDMVPATKRFLWIGTADIKDLYVAKGKKMVPFLEILSDLLNKAVEIRLVYAKEPGPAFRKDFDKYPNLIHGLEQMHCPRVHFKTIISDGKKAFTGSANLTGAGVGAKSKNNRNFEAGILTTDPAFIEKLMTQFDKLWIGANCKACGRKQYCSEWQQFEIKGKKSR